MSKLFFISGSIITCIAFSLSVFSVNVPMLMLLYGVLGGFGLGLIYLPSVCAVGYYFEKKRALATGNNYNTIFRSNHWGQKTHLSGPLLGEIYQIELTINDLVLLYFILTVILKLTILAPRYFCLRLRGGDLRVRSPGNLSPGEIRLERSKHHFCRSLSSVRGKHPTSISFNENKKYY